LEDLALFPLAEPRTASRTIFVTTHSDNPSRHRSWHLAAIFAGTAFGVVYLVTGLFSAWRVDGPGLVQAGLPLGRDFVSFWSASALALAGAPEAAFDLARLHAAEIAAVGAPIAAVAWHYPPTFLLVVLPLAMLPYVAALTLWLLVPILAFWAVLRRLFENAVAAWLLLLFPAIPLSLASGQNGAITAALLGGALLALDKAPLLAGMLVGLLTYKPHLAALVFPALVFGRHWRTLAAAAVTSLAMIALSLLVFGPAPWLAFLADLDGLARMIEDGAVPWVRLPTVYAAARILGCDVTAAQLIQAAVAAAAVVALCTIWYRRSPLAWRGAALALAVPLATPYAFDYDLVVLVLPLAWLMVDAFREKPPMAEQALLALAWVSPALFWVIVAAGGPPLMPAMLAALFVLVWRRAFPREALSPMPSVRTV
jgi:alpha-1,2-mannosyltransferase